MTTPTLEIHATKHTLPAKVLVELPAECTDQERRYARYLIESTIAHMLKKMDLWGRVSPWSLVKVHENHETATTTYRSVDSFYVTEIVSRSPMGVFV